ncbi:MAG: DUF3343 domain-containing protein [Oscillospiraceae bacterium]|nr:DUF3343 domain-containing protein [Oscillospiraceae bacterium]
MTLVILTSITFAYKAKDILKNRGIRSRVVKTPVEAGLAGCSYSLELPERGREAADILKSSGLKIQGIIKY